MKKRINLSTLALLLLFNFTSYGQGNQAKIFELTEKAQAQALAAEIAEFIADRSVHQYPPSETQLTEFMVKAYEELSLELSNSSCTEAGVRVFLDNSKINFRYDNIDSDQQEKLLFVGLFNYNNNDSNENNNGNNNGNSANGSSGSFANGDDSRRTYLFYGPYQFDGSDVELGSIQCHVVLTGVLCNTCSDGSNTCISKIEIIVIDKNILKDDE